MSIQREGYVKTEIGVLPDDWQVCSLRELGRFKNGINKDSSAFGSGLPFVNLMDVFGKNAVAALEDLGLLQSTSIERTTYNLKQGDVLFVRSSVKPSGVGLTALVEEDLPETVFSGFLLRFRDQGRLDLEFKKHVFYAEAFRKELIGKSSVSANTNINQSALLTIKIPVPPNLAEQQAIAKALGDVDGLIASLEALIAKKRDIKQGAMQELLSGHRRLPGFAKSSDFTETEVGLFPSDWTLTSIEAVASITTGSRNTQDRIDDGEFPFFVRSQTVERINSYSYDCEAVVTAGDGVGTGKIFHYINGKFDLHQRCYAITDFSEQLFGYYFYIWFSIKFFDRIMSMTAKSSVDSVRREMISKMLMALPSYLEQKAIALMLSDMDAEITTLEAKLAKTRDVRQGMMQVLLTGEVRLV